MSGQIERTPLAQQEYDNAIAKFAAEVERVGETGLQRIARLYSEAEKAEIEAFERSPLARFMSSRGDRQ